ncbi:hypothetical protein TcarDRAFT_1059 [Thermosinus carboxydivorans Nor1]|uniref:Uncharacterized protein n=1 Tax=Thermosinus carboxydivorans Nor1 TaxID=401526 RepID=A1HQS6_9FIRM|nr:hypothetical protein [Thermosinus carboxydivorans]EAX47637.1 hypothetical protein TcarDRAFT_1059 [Thermosinus carboxydivorans Nor1]
MAQPGRKRSYSVFFSGFAIGVLTVFIVLYFTAPQLLLPPQPKPHAPVKAPYEYYVILDEATGATIMYVSVVTVNPGDELITEDNKRYVVIRVEENRAYARYVEDVNVRTKREPAP